MADDPALKAPVEIIPSLQDGVSGLASSHAPFLYFENAPVFGSHGGVLKVTLTSSRELPYADGSFGHDHVVVAHLRMNLEAAKALKAALDGAILLATPTSSEAKN